MKGGARPGAGRKPREVIAAVRNWAAEILPDEKENAYWRSLLENPKTRADALRFLSEHKHGKAKQAIEHTGDAGGPIEHCIRFVSAANGKSDS